jgi:hypothetical protein
MFYNVALTALGIYLSLLYTFILGRWSHVGTLGYPLKVILEWFCLVFFVHETKSILNVSKHAFLIYVTEVYELKLLFL